jgi:hypothetical protein
MTYPVIYETPYMVWFGLTERILGQEHCTPENMIKYEMYCLHNLQEARAKYIQQRRSYTRGNTPYEKKRYNDLLKIISDDKQFGGLSLLFGDLY